MDAVAFFVRYFLVFILAIELLALPFELAYLDRKSKRVRPRNGELMDVWELLVLINILATIILAIVVVITQHIMF